MFIVGIDIARCSHMVRVIDSEGRTVYKPFSIRNSCSGCSVLLERLRKLTNHKSEFLFAMESTAHYWLALYTRLRKEGYQVVVLNPIQADAIREMLMEENKAGTVQKPFFTLSTWVAISNGRSPLFWTRYSRSLKASSVRSSGKLPLPLCVSIPRRRNCPGRRPES